MASKKELEDMVIELSKKNDELSNELVSLKEKNVKLDRQLERMVDASIEELYTPQDSQEVSFRGKTFKILHVDEAREIDRAIKRGYIVENATCLVLDREGD